MLQVAGFLLHWSPAGSISLGDAQLKSDKAMEAGFDTGSATHKISLSWKAEPPLLPSILLISADIRLVQRRGTRNGMLHFFLPAALASAPLWCFMGHGPTVPSRGNFGYN